MSHFQSKHGEAHHDVPPDFRGAFRTDFLARSLYAEGAGIARTLPWAVAVPHDTADVSLLVAWAKREGHGIIPRGSGSGMAAGAVGRGVILDVSRFTEIGEVDVANRSIRAGCGAIRADIDRAARQHGLRFPVNPSSGAFCTIGGMSGTNAAGAQTLRYGATRPWVRGIRCVFDDGADAWVRRGEALPRVPAVQRLLAALNAIRDHARTGSADDFVHLGVRKESSGYALGLDAVNGLRTIVPTAERGVAGGDGDRIVDVLVGSEGTLAVFTEIELALIAVAGATASVLAIFPSLESATACATEARTAGAAACELLDRSFLDVAASSTPTGIPAGTEAVLLVEVEGDDALHAAAIVASLTQTFRALGATSTTTALDPESEGRMWTLRHAASPILARLAPRVRSMQFIEDGCVPPQNFPTYVRGVREALSRAGIPGVIFGHAGDAHAHVNPLVNTHQSGWQDRVRALLDDVCALTARCGGTLAGEHGDGRLRAPLLPRVWSTAALAAFTNVKAAGDPAGALNPGCKIAHAGDDGLASIRYDLDAAPLHPRARAALDAIERDRAWNRFRLDAAPRNET